LHASARRHFSTMHTVVDNDGLRLRYGRWIGESNFLTFVPTVRIPVRLALRISTSVRDHGCPKRDLYC